MILSLYNTHTAKLDHNKKNEFIQDNLIDRRMLQNKL